MPQLMRYGAIGTALLVLAAVLGLQDWALHLFAFHMTQHLLLIALAAPLLVLGGLQFQVRPVLAWLLFVGTFLFWHVPATFQWAANAHATLFELATILGAAWIFWSAVLGDNPLNDGGKALMVMLAAIVTDLPGVVMLFAPRALCVMPQEDAARFHLTPLQDQQMAGLLMWVPANLVFFGIALFLFARWISNTKPANALVTS